MFDLVGKQFGDYHIISLLGRGGFAEVYLGRHIQHQTNYAIKILHLGSDEEVRRFWGEANTIKRLKHRNIVRILDFGVGANLPFFVMDYAPHGTLNTRHPVGSRLQLDTIIHYIKQIAAALDYVHDKK